MPVNDLLHSKSVLEKVLEVLMDKCLMRINLAFQKDLCLPF